jgi:RNA polymerase sigma-70 factor (ECF subfamily)
MIERTHADISGYGGIVPIGSPVTMLQHHPVESTLDAARRGDERAAERLYRAHQPMLLRYLRSQEPRVAEDLAAEVWLAAAKALPDFEGDERGFRSWLFTVAKRRVIEHRRRGLRRRTDPVDPYSFTGTSEGADEAVRATDLVEGQRAVDLMSQHLTPDQAEVLILRVVADLSAAQVAGLMERPEAWVRVTQHRALKRLTSRVRTELEAAP